MFLLTALASKVASDETIKSDKTVAVLSRMIDREKAVGPTIMHLSPLLARFSNAQTTMRGDDKIWQITAF